jgi:hypothetical protein
MLVLFAPMSFVPIGAAEEEQGRTWSKKNNPEPCEKGVPAAVAAAAVGGARTGPCANAATTGVLSAAGPRCSRQLWPWTDI